MVGEAVLWDSGWGYFIQQLYVIKLLACMTRNN